jgi:hypothetical protein
MSCLPLERKTAGSLRRQPFQSCERCVSRLPMTTAVEAARSSREASPSAATRESAARYRSVIESHSTASDITRPTVVATAPAVVATASAVVATVSAVVATVSVVPVPVISVSVVSVSVVSVPIAVKPRASSDKHAAQEPIRSVIAIRCASIRIISVIPVRTDWRWAVRVGGSIPTETNAERDSLRVRVTRAQQANR